MSPEIVIARLNDLMINPRDAEVIERSFMTMVYPSIAAALADRLQIDGEAMIVEDEPAFVLVVAHEGAIRAAGLGDRAHPMTEIAFRHAADAAQFMAS